MTIRTNVRRALFSAAVIALGLAAAPRASQAQPGPAQLGKPVKQHQDHKDPAAMKAPGQAKREAPVATTTAAPAAPVATPPTGAEVGTAVDAMSATCGKALALSTQIDEAVGRRKTSLGARMKSSLELKKKLRAVLTAQKKVARLSKKAGTDAAAIAESARVEYEAALAQAKTVEVETQTAQTAQDELATLVAAAEEASASCATYEASIRKAATEARKAVELAKRSAAKARLKAALPALKAREAARALAAKELEANKTGTEGARTALETMKADAAKQPAPTAPAAGKPEHPNKNEGKPEHAGKPEHGKPEGKKAPAEATKPK